MALKTKSMFLYGLQITTDNSSIDFKTSAGGSVLQATLDLGFYSLTDLMAQIKSAMEAVDLVNTYTVTADRTYSGGTQNRITISTSGSYLSLLFGSGPRVASSVAPLIGFPTSDFTGATSYTGTSSAGTVLIPALTGYNWIPPTQYRKVFGSLNVSATGEKEAIVFQIQEFFQVQFKYEPQATIELTWPNLMNWLIQQRPLEFTPEITSPSVFYNCTLEKTGADGKGLGFQMKEMLPQFPNLWDTGMLTFRKKI